MTTKSRVVQQMEHTDQSRHDEVHSMLNKELLSPLVCKAVKKTDVEIQTSDCVPMKGGVSGGSVYKISGRGIAENNPLQWKLILKILNRPANITDPNDTTWKREVLAYESGLLEDLPGGLRAAECYQIEYISDTEIWMWFEDVSEPEHSVWSIERHGLAARHAGQLNGSYLTDRALPSYEWLLIAKERTAIPRDCNFEVFNFAIDYLQSHYSMSPASTQSALRFWSEKEVILSNLYDRLPQTFGHYDLDRRNVFSRTKIDGSEETVAIDWGMLGIEAVGSELSKMITHNLNLDFVKIEQAGEFYAVVLDDYLKGLKDVEWMGNPDLVRYGCAAFAGLELLRGWSKFGTYISDEDKRRWIEQFFNRPFEDFMALQAQLTTFTLELVDEARHIEQTLF